MIRSMTGFGRAQLNLDGMDLSVEVSSVNRRNLELSVSMPREWQSLERAFAPLVRDCVHRGKLQIQIQATPAAGEAGFTWDTAGFDASLKRLEEAARRHGIPWEPDAGTLARVAALNKVEMVLPSVERVSQPLLDTLSEAIRALVEMRETEGAALRLDLDERLDSLGTELDTIRQLSTDTVPVYREMLMQRLRQSDLELDLEDERILKEVALFADKCDIAEEITRLDSHLDQFRTILEEGGVVGRKLEFLLQEVNREYNTIGSKGNNLGISRCVIEAKNEIERIREQLQNIE